MGAYTHVFSVMGHYAATWNGADIGTTEDGWSIEVDVSDDAIHCDDLGDCLANAVLRGGNVRVVGRGLEYSKLRPALMAAWGTSGFAAGLIGQLASTIAKPLRLSPVLVGGDAGNVRKLFTFGLTYVRGNVIPLNNRLATVDVVFTALVDENGKYFLES
jgi:hypothetical protein